MTAKFLFGIICDTIRRETSGKDILVGVYGKDIVLPSFPAHVMLSLWARAMIEANKNTTVDFRIVTGSGHQLLPTSRMVFPPPPDPSSPATLVFDGIPIQIQGPDTILFQAKQDGGDWEDIASVTATQGVVDNPSATIVRASPTAS